MINYIKQFITKVIKLDRGKIKHNYQLEQLYNPDNYSEMLMQLQEYNLIQSIPYMACGMSGYFNIKVEELGINNLKLDGQDKEDAKFIAACFGKKTNYSDNGLSVLYITLLGTTEFNYAMQTFPAGIYEDVFQCSANHSFPIRPIVGESEVDFYIRILEYQISQCPAFPLEKKDEVLYRAKRLINRFCCNKNRVYLVPYDNVSNNKASFGDINGLRDGNISGNDMKSKIDELPTLEQLLEHFYISIDNFYDDPNMTSEYGVAIYGTILNRNISYIEVDRTFELLQEKAKKLGYIDGEAIPIELANQDFPKISM